MIDLKRFSISVAALGLLAVTGSNAMAGIVGFSFDARAYGQDFNFLATAGNVSVSGTYDDSITDVTVATCDDQLVASELDLHRRSAPVERSNFNERLLFRRIGMNATQGVPGWPR